MSLWRSSIIIIIDTIITIIIILTITITITIMINNNNFVKIIVHRRKFGLTENKKTYQNYYVPSFQARKCFKNTFQEKKPHVFSYHGWREDGASTVESRPLLVTALKSSPVLE